MRTYFPVPCSQGKVQAPVGGRLAVDHGCIITQALLYLKERLGGEDRRKDSPLNRKAGM